MAPLSPSPRIGRSLRGVGPIPGLRQAERPPRRVAAPDGGGAALRPCPVERALLRLLAARAWQSRDGPAPRGRGPAEGGGDRLPAAEVAARGNPARRLHPAATVQATAAAVTRSAGAERPPARPVRHAPAPLGEPLGSPHPGSPRLRARARLIHRQPGEDGSSGIRGDPSSLLGDPPPKKDDPSPKKDEGSPKKDEASPKMDERATQKAEPT